MYRRLCFDDTSELVSGLIKDWAFKECRAVSCSRGCGVVVMMQLLQLHALPVDISTLRVFIDRLRKTFAGTKSALVIG